MKIGLDGGAFLDPKHARCQPKSRRMVNHFGGNSFRGSDRCEQRGRVAVCQNRLQKIVPERTAGRADFAGRHPSAQQSVHRPPFSRGKFCLRVGGEAKAGAAKRSLQRACLFEIRAKEAFEVLRLKDSHFAQRFQPKRVRERADRQRTVSEMQQAKSRKRVCSAHD